MKKLKLKIKNLKWLLEHSDGRIDNLVNITNKLKNQNKLISIQVSIQWLLIWALIIFLIYNRQAF